LKSRRKSYPIPKYLDDLPEVIVVPIDEFMVFLATFLLLFFINTILAAFAAVIAYTIYHKAKKGKPKNYYLLLLYKLGLVKPKGIPTPTSKEFQE